MATIANSVIGTKPAEAPVVAQKKRSWVPFTLSLLFMLLIAAVPAVSATATFNLSVITDVINAFIDLITPITNLVVAIVPLWFIMEILGFIMGLLALILGMIHMRKR
jgi:hypothetical protein